MESAKPKDAARKPGGRKWLFATVVAVVAVAGSSCFYYFRNAKNPSAPEVRKPYVAVHLEPFVVNLADDGQNAYLKIGIDLAVEDSGNEKKPSASPLQTAPLRDSLLQILMTARSEELATTEGKQELKHLIMQKLNSQIPEVRVREVYFTDFLVQK